MKLRAVLIAAVVAMWAAVMVRAAAGQGPVVPAPPADAVAGLAQRLQAGDASLQFDGPAGYLRSILRQLNINEDSQMLVFSKTSLDTPYVSPQTPRAIYFNDTAVVALTPGSPDIEFTAVGPRSGLSFYTLDVRETPLPAVKSHSDCRGCHQGVTTPNVTSLVLMSLPTRPDGNTFDFLPFEYVNQRTPFADRWGGWYVTGTHGSQRHRGNAFTTDPAHVETGNTPGTQNVTSLADRFDTSRYLTGTSDIVALMTFEHQAQVTNLMFAATRAAQLVQAATPQASAATTAALDQAIESLVTCLLFADEAELREPVRGVSTFSRTFPARGPRDAAGRSLRDFDLERRVFRYPMSYMIYADIFDALPEVVRDRVYRRLFDVLTSTSPEAPFSRLSADDRRAALEIVRDTKPGLPSYWRSSPVR